MSRERESLVEVEAGLHVVQYVGAARAEDGPNVQVSVDPGSRGRAQVISDPRSLQGELAGPGTALVVRAEGRVTLKVQVRSRFPDGSLDARIEVRAIGAGPPPSVAARQSPPPSSGLRVLGHLARRGDVWAGPGEWIGGPTSPLPIEGIEIQPGSTMGQGRLEYQVLTGKRAPRWSPWVEGGGFCGTRGRALPVGGIRLRVSGPYRLRVEALFLGSAVQAKNGAEVELVGPSGQEPLVGLSVALDPTSWGEQNVVEEPALRERSGRVRVFRAGST